MTIRRIFIFLSLFVIVAVLALAQQWPTVHWFWVVVVPVLLVGFHDMLQTKHTILRIYPVIGHFRYMFESVRSEIQQYFVESDLDGTPINREFRSLAYQRAKRDNDTRAFGTIFDVYRDGYEWLNQSLAPTTCNKEDLRIHFGGQACKNPYSASPFNISAMSFGALSHNAIVALNRGARRGNFAHNTGEGDISPCHLEEGAAPVELTNSVGTPLRDALHFVHYALLGIGVRDELRTDLSVHPG